MRNIAHEEFNLLNRNSQLTLCDDVLVNIRVDLNNFSLMLHASCVVVPNHGTFAESEEVIFDDTIGKLVLSRLYHCQMQLTSQKEIKVLGLVALFVKWHAYLQFAHLAVHQELTKIRSIISNFRIRFHLPKQTSYPYSC